MNITNPEDPTNLLFDAIRRELNEIIKDGASSTNDTETDDVENSKKKKNDANSKKPRTSFSRNRSSSTYDITKQTIRNKTPPNNADISKINPNETISAIPSQNIDIELQRMQLDLKQSYELFQSISEKFEAINFGCLRNRIKDLHLNTKHTTDAGTTTRNDLKGLFEDNYVKNRLSKLTTEMGEQFGKHPGEFGDIPEVSAFFTACTQLQNGLAKLKRQRNEMSELGKRISLATEASYDRIEVIKRAIGDKNKITESDGK